MASNAVVVVTDAMDGNACGSQNTVDRLKLLYPMVNEEETPLPRSWSPKDKYNYIGLSQNNLRVHYKGRSRSAFHWLMHFLLRQGAATNVV